MQQLNTDIITRRSAGDVLYIYEGRRSEFDVYNTITALHRVAKLASQPGMQEGHVF
jgi:hypothetical protein